MKLYKRILIVIGLLLLLITNFAYSDENDKGLGVSKPAINNPKIIVVSSIDDIDKDKINPGDTIQIDERSTKSYSTETNQSIIATYEESGITFTSYSNTFPTEESLKNLHDELMKNEHYKEYKKLGSVTIYPDGPENTLGKTLSSFNQKDVVIRTRHKYIPYEYIGADIEIYQTEQSYHDELSEILPTLSHEYGHVFTFNYMVEGHHQLPSDVLSDYVEIRGIEGNSNLRNDNSNERMWNVAEIMAEDYRVLFGTEENPAQHENQEIPNILSEPYYSKVINFWNETLIKNGNGTSSDPYKISTEYQLSQISYYNGGSNYYKLINDINLGAAKYLEYKGNWFPLESFDGVLDGDNNSIRNLRIDTTYIGSTKNYSFGANYGIIRQLDGIVKNLDLDNVKINGRDYVGSIAAHLKSSGAIFNCSVNGNVEGDNYVGGLVSINEGTIENCSGNATVIGDEYVGGLVAKSNKGIINRNTFKGAISGDDFVGGLVGGNSQGDISHNEVDVTVKQTNSCFAGGLLGHSYYGIVNHNSVKATVNGKNETGGLIGGSSGDDIKYNYIDVEITGYDRTGGLIGSSSSNSNSNIHNNYCKGIVKGAKQTGGLIGKNYGPVNNNHVDVIVNGYYYTGGVIGYNTDGDINNNIAMGKVTGYSYVGGIIGESQDGNVFNNIAQNDSIISTNNENHFRRILGYNYDENTTLQNNYALNSMELENNTPISDINGKDGLSKSLQDLSNQSTYEELGFDFKTNWDMLIKENGIITPVLKGINQREEVIYDNGTTVKIAVYEKDIIKYIKVFENNKLQYKEEYNEKFKLIAKYTYYNNDDTDLKYRYIYDENEKLIYKEEYKNYKLIAKYTYYKDVTGKLRYKYKYVYKSDGTIECKIEYNSGKMIYKYTYYDNDEDNLKYMYVYDASEKVKYKYLFKSGIVVYKYTYYKNNNGDYKYKYKYFYNETGLRYTKRYSYIDKKTINVNSEDQNEIKKQYYWSNITFIEVGSYLKVYENGTIKFKLRYDSNGNIIRKYTYYKGDDNKYRYKFIHYYSSTGNLKYSHEYENGKKIAKYTYYKDDKGTYLWKYKYAYDNDGIIQYKYEYKAGVKIKKYTYYRDSNGKYRYKYIYNYDSKSELQYKEEYKAGVRTKKYTYYKDDNGKYRYKYLYVYNSKGIIQYKYEYNKGVKIAKYTYYVDKYGKYRYKYKYMYDNNGNLAFKNEYNAGKIIATYIYYIDSNGKYRYLFKYVFKKDGNIDYMYEYSNGKKVYKYTFYIDNYGEYKLKFRYVYDSKEKLQYKEEYYNGTKILKYTYYTDSNGKYRYKYKYYYDDSGQEYLKRYDYTTKEWKYYN